MEWTDSARCVGDAPVGRHLLGHDPELGSSGFGARRAAGWGHASSQNQEELGVEPILRPGGVHGGRPSLRRQGTSDLYI